MLKGAWCDYSDLKEGNTIELPPKPTKPNIPQLTASARKINLIAVMPENTCTGTNSETSPIVSWKISGFYKIKDSDEQVEKVYKLSDTDSMATVSCLPIMDLDHNQEYTLQISAENEAGWSEPSEKFKIHIASPSVPKDFHVSSKSKKALIKLRWKASDTSLITHYQIEKGLIAALIMIKFLLKYLVISLVQHL